MSPTPVVDRSIVLAADLPEPLVAAVRGAATGSPVTRARGDELLAALDAGTVEVVVLPAPTADAVVRVRRIRELDRDVPVVLVTPADRHPVVERAVRLDPLVGRSTRCAPDDDAGALGRLVAETAEAGARRRSNATVLRRVGATPLPAGLAEPATASQYLGQLLEHATIGVVTLDHDGTIRGWNPKAAAVTGRRQRDAVGRPAATLFRAPEAARLRDAVQRAVSTTEATTEVLARAGPDGAEQWLEITAASIGEGPDSLGTLLLVHDITGEVRAERELAARMRHSALSADVGLAVTGTGDLGEQLQRCAEAVVEHLDAAFARIWTLEPDGDALVLRASAGCYTHLDGAHSRVPVGDLKIGRIASTREPHLSNDVPNDPRISDPDWARREGMVAFAGCPLVIAHRVVGVLALFSRRPLPDVTMDALASVADTIAVAIQQASNARQVSVLLDRERAARREAEDALDRNVSLLRTLQQSLLPPALPTLPGLDLSARYHWAGSGDQVGGDFYDGFPLADGRYCVAIGDVSGKGVEAAALTSLARHTLRAAARHHASAEAVLRALNEIVLEQTDDERFCTVVLVTFEPHHDEWEARIANAGHVPPLWVAPDGAVRPVGGPGLPVGLFADLDVAESPVTLRSGEVLVLFTDGVTEARSPDGRFRPELVHEVLHGARSAPAAEITATLERAVVDLQEGRPRDDLAVVAVRPVGPDGPGGADRWAPPDRGRLL